MKLADKLAVPAIVVAGGMVYVAEEFNMPYLIPLGIGLFGLFGIILGIETFASGRIEMLNRLHSRREYLSDVPARLFGVMGSTTETVSRVMSRFTDDGLVKSGRKWLTIIDAKRLEELGKRGAVN